MMRLIPFAYYMRAFDDCIGLGASYADISWAHHMRTLDERIICGH
jgi:hypothetical protein